MTPQQLAEEAAEKINGYLCEMSPINTIHERPIRAIITSTFTPRIEELEELVKKHEHELDWLNEKCDSAVHQLNDVTRERNRLRHALARATAAIEPAKAEKVKDVAE